MTRYYVSISFVYDSDAEYDQVRDDIARVIPVRPDAEHLQVTVTPERERLTP